MDEHDPWRQHALSQVGRQRREGFRVGERGARLVAQDPETASVAHLDERVVSGAVEVVSTVAEEDEVGAPQPVEKVGGLLEIVALLEIAAIALAVNKF